MLIRASASHLFVVLALLSASCAVGGDEEDGEEEVDSAITASPPFYGDPANHAAFAVDVSHHEGMLAARELDCFWDSGVRHVIAGTQVEEVVREQLDIAVSRGMTVDAYVYLYWRDVAAQVQTAFARTAGFPIQRMWIDVEDPPGSLGANSLIALIQEALTECRKHAGVVCGIYTGSGFWKTYMTDTTVLAGVPLWYARYGGGRLLSDWSLDRFGGWTAPVGKQWAEEPLCHVGVDKDTIQVEAPPTVVVDRSLQPDTGMPPPAPTGLFPRDGGRIGVDYVHLMTSTIPRATLYELSLERWQQGKWATYTTWKTPDAFKRVYPPRDYFYRFRARATSARGVGPWSPWNRFQYGTVAGPLPP